MDSFDDTDTRKTITTRSSEWFRFNAGEISVKSIAKTPKNVSKYDNSGTFRDCRKKIFHIKRNWANEATSTPPGIIRKSMVF